MAKMNSSLPPEPLQPPPAAPLGLGPVLRPGVRRREALGWAMFDFANSGYTTVVITAIYGAYFVAVVAGGTTWATLAWTAALAFSNLLVLLSAPVLGAWADVHAGKKRLAALTTVGCVLTTAALGWIGPGSVVLALALLVLSNAFFSTGGNLVAAFLPELARPQRLGTLSGWGWGLGYVGGLLCLALCLAYIHWAQARGHTASEFVPVTLLITAALFALTALPFFFWVRERALPQPKSAVSAWAQVAKTWREAARFQDMRRFLICIVFYQAGIMTVIALAAIYAQEVMGFDTAQTVMMIFVVNITAAIGALGFGYLQDRIGPVRGIALTLLGWIAMVLVAWSSESAASFWLAANLAGLCLGASQSAGRALVGYLAPDAQRAEFFGLWGLAVMLASIVGPLTYGLVTWLTGGDHRSAMLVTGLYFVLGLLLLRGVNAERGYRAAQAVL